MDKWYKKSYRRSLVDMHIADWNDKFLRDFNIDDYYETLKIGKIQSPMIYLQSHTGLCNYPTKTGKMHNAFRENPYKLRNLIEKCKKGGMTPVGYYSLVFNNWAEDNHSDWAMRNYKGENWRTESGVRYGLCCPNNIDYRNFVESQIKELSQIFTLDGIFFDMPYWEMLCHCDSCKKKWKEKYNTEMPVKIDWQDNNWLNYIRMRQLWMGDFVRFVKSVTDKYMPDTTVEFNYAAIIGCDWLGGSTELINNGCEFASGDLYGDIYSHSFACKYYSSVTKNQPFEYMTSRCDPNLREHTVLKSENRLTREVLLTTAHHGASLIIDAIDPAGTLDKRVYERVGKVFEKQIPHEKYFQGDYVSDVAVFFDSTTQFSSSGYEFFNKKCCIGAVRKLTEDHIPVNILSNGNMDTVNNYKLIIAPALEDFDNDNILKLIDYVRNGGKLILTSKSEHRLMEEFFGGEFSGFTDENMVYIRPVNRGNEILSDFTDNYPAPFKYKLPVYKFNKKVEVLAEITKPGTNPCDNSIFTSIHSNPPFVKTDIPAMVKTNYGKGQVIWIGACVEIDQRESYKNLFNNCIYDLIGYNDLSWHFTGSEKIEVTMFKDDSQLIVHFIDLYEDENIDREFSFEAFQETAPTKVFDGVTKEKYDFVYANNMVKFSGKFKTFKTIIIK